MQFEMNHKVETDYSTVTFNNLDKINEDCWKSLWKIFERLGMRFQEDSAVMCFPKHITSEVLSEVIHNTCFVCGGLMQDSIAIVDHKFVYTDAGKELWKNSAFASQVKVRKCSSCGHSHT